MRVKQEMVATVPSLLDSATVLAGNPHMPPRCATNRQKFEGDDVRVSPGQPFQSSSRQREGRPLPKPSERKACDSLLSHLLPLVVVTYMKATTRFRCRCSTFHPPFACTHRPPRSLRCRARAPQNKAPIQSHREGTLSAAAHRRGATNVFRQ